MKHDECSPLHTCGVHAHCDINLSQCVCDSGWSGLGDYATVYVSRCDIYLPAIFWLSVLNVIISGSTALLFLRILYWRLFRRGYVVDRGNIAIVCYILDLSAEVIYACLKIVNPTKYIAGKSWVTTVIFCVQPFFTFCACVSFFGVVFTFFKGFTRVIRSEQARSIENWFNKVDWWSVFLSPLYFVFCFCPILILIVGYSKIFVIAYFLGVSFIVSGLCLTLVLTLRKMKKVVASSINHDNDADETVSQLKLLLLKLGEAEELMKPPIVWVPCMHAVFCLWWYMEEKIAYFLLIVNITNKPPLISLLLILAPYSAGSIFTFAGLRRLVEKITRRSREVVPDDFVEEPVAKIFNESDSARYSKPASTFSSKIPMSTNNDRNSQSRSLGVIFEVEAEPSNSAPRGVPKGELNDPSLSRLAVNSRHTSLRKHHEGLESNAEQEEFEIDCDDSRRETGTGGDKDDGEMRGPVAGRRGLNHCDIAALRVAEEDAGQEEDEDER